MSVDAAGSLANDLLSRQPPLMGGADGRERRTWWAIGDPQAPFEIFATILGRHGLLGGDGRLLPDVGLVSIGDHFDFGKGPDFAAIGREGEKILRWLAAHPSDQTVILLGNHDTVRVQEFALLTDASFQHAQGLAIELQQLAPGRGETPSAEFEAARQRFVDAHPLLPPPGVVSRDFSAFQVSQRDLLQALLVSRRVRLAAAATLPDGESVLVNHAGFTQRELQLLAAPEQTPIAIAEALDAFLARAVDAVAPSWRTGELKALDLSPLHMPGSSGQEGGGLLYHRAANGDRARSDKAWESAGPAPRRYSPYALPLGLAQVCGHSGHRKLREELKPWVEPDALAVEMGGLRTLSCDGAVVRYRMGIHAPRPGSATVYLIDGEMNSAPVESYPLFRLGRVR